MMAFIRRFARNHSGATSIEYSIIAVLVSIVGIGALIVIGPAVMTMFQDASAPF